jgi:biofilm PGA synthesis lipoprotein PgaB
MRWLALLVFVLASHMTIALAAPAAGDSAAADPYAAAGAFVALSYHEARDEVRDYPDPYAVDTAALVRQFAWLRGNGYTPVSVDQIVAARNGDTPLPAKAVLLSFDDAYLSFYDRVYPLLREFGFPAVLAVVGKWIDNPHGGSAPYGEKATVADASFPTWSQLREMADSGLVELASHTYDLHRGVPANPQGTLQPAATARTYDAATGSYEGDASWRARVSTDLARNVAVIERETGHRPRVVVWPYGSYNDELVGMAGASGMSIGLTLDDGANTPDVPLTALRRTLVEHNPPLAEFIVEVRGPRHPEPRRVVQINLDDVYSADPARQERNLSALLDRMQVLKPTHVYLQATTDADGDGVADAAYFPNRHLPLRGDLFNRTAWQLASRVDVKVFAVMPVTGFRMPQNTIADIYEDLARHANFDGLVFDEMSSPGSIEDAGTVEFTRRLAQRARAFRAPLQTVRTMNIEPSVATAPDTAAVAQHLERLAVLAAAYDYVALVATPAPDPASPEAWLARLTAGMTRAPGGPDMRRKLVFMLKNSPPGADRPTGPSIARQMQALQLGGALNFGYVADDFLHDNPPLAQVAPAMSLRAYPLARENKER